MSERVGFYRSPIGFLKITIDAAQRLKQITWIEEGEPLLQKLNESSLQNVYEQLDAYFAGSLQRFSLPFTIEGTDFYRQVLKKVATIPYGETRSYQQIARECGHPKAARAVGQAVHRNPIPIVIPCHRVIGAGGKLVGYAGGCEKKCFLLHLEGVL